MDIVIACCLLALLLFANARRHRRAEQARQRAGERPRRSLADW